jgi:hypothetical protein
MTTDVVSQLKPGQSERAIAGIVSMMKRSSNVLKVRVGSWQRSRDQDALERALANIIETANGHRTKGVPRGSLVYSALRDRADARIDAYCKKWNVDRSTIEAEAPSLKDLRDLCIADKETPLAIKALTCLLGGILIMLLIGAASGIIHAGHNGVFHLLSR